MNRVTARARTSKRESKKVRVCHSLTSASAAARFPARTINGSKISKGHLLKSVDPPLTPLFQDGGAWTAFRELVPCIDIVSSTISNLYTHIYFFLAGVGLD